MSHSINSYNGNRNSCDVYLTSDERYQIWRIKAVERPHLLETYDSTTNEDVCSDNDGADAEEKEGNNSSTISQPLPLPLQDGCDIPAWRKATVVASVLVDQPNLASILNVGMGCKLLRRERQIPQLKSQRRSSVSPSLLSSLEKISIQQEKQQLSWDALRELLLQDPPASRKPSRVDYYENDNGDGNCHQRNSDNHCSNNSKRQPLQHPAWFERANVPAVVDGACDDWPAYAQQTCSFENLLKRFGGAGSVDDQEINEGNGTDIEWRFSDTHGETMSLRSYQKYIHAVDGGLTDDAPLAIYDSQFAEDDHDKRKEIARHDYSVPSCFDYDLFDLLDNKDDDSDDNSYDDSETGGDSVSENSKNECGNDNPQQLNDRQQRRRFPQPQRPPYRWILMGPARSGTGLHVDPVGTHAWVSLVQGCKRWVLFPPETPRDCIGMQEPQIPSVIWFRDYYYTYRHCGGRDQRLSQQQRQHFDNAVEILQRPGETVYVPAGWPHVVLNLEFSTALTHNYASEYPSIGRLMEAIETEETGLAEPFRSALVTERPDLAEQLD